MQFRADDLAANGYIHMTMRQLYVYNHDRDILQERIDDIIICSDCLAFFSNWVNESATLRNPRRYAEHHDLLCRFSKRLFQ